MLSFGSDESITFDGYNVIIGPNDSGKTNLVRVIEFMTNSDTTVDDKRIELSRKFDANKSSYIHIDIHLEKEEMRALFELLFNRTVDLIEYDDKMATLSIFIEWTNLYDDGSRPDFVILYFYNRLILWKNGSYLNVSYLRKLPETIDEIKSEIEQTIEIEGNQEMVNNYHSTHGYAHTELFGQETFQHSLLNGSDINEFFDIGHARVRIRVNPFSVSYNADYTNQQKAHVVRTFGFIGTKYQSANSANLWLIVVLTQIGYIFDYPHGLHFAA